MTMNAISLFLPLSISSFQLGSHYSSSKIHLSASIISSSKLANTTSGRRKAVVFKRNSRDPNNESRFFNEDGVVDDMDGYLNYLSLEYDSVWDTKPSWCQPWTIILTGLLVIAGSWFLIQSAVVTAIVLLLICTWWYVFLYSYPKAYTDMIAERRKRVTSGIEDTFGSKTSP